MNLRDPDALADHIEGVRAVLFDAVGTVIEPDPPVFEVYRRVGLDHGVEIEDDEIKRRFRSAFALDEHDEQRGPGTTSEAIEYRRWRRIVTACLPEVPDPVSAFEQLWAHFARPDAWRVVEEIPPLLGWLQARGIVLRIASNFDGRLRAILDGLPDLEPLRTDPLISSEIGARKPHPAFFQAALNALQLSPEQVLLIGDDPINDRQGAQEAGIRCLLIK